VGISSPDVLVSILHKAASSYEDSAFHLTLNSLSAILRLGLLDLQFWEQTLSREAFISVVKSLILFDPRSKVREIAVQIIEEHVSLDDQLSVAAKNEESSTYSLHPHRLARFFWSVILDILPEASFTSENCHEFFALSQFLLCSVFNRWTNLVDFHTTAERSSQLLLDHASLEVSFALHRQCFIANARVRILTRPNHATLLRMVSPRFFFPACSKTLQFPIRSHCLSKYISSHLRFVGVTN
jgi:hypothetical protein